ncbi:MAG TPA: hypothetical protein VMF57_15850 [Solirubrobacteraceae bacterium]|nr:hypothetical protein [Solirubrobacteraceae bacterium]
MTDHDPAAARARGQAIRKMRLARVRTIRRRIIAGSLALFVASWLLITIVLVSGHDPALAKNSSATTTTSSGTTTTSSSQTNGSSATVSSVTTSQS